MKRFTSCRNISNCRSLLAVACLGASLTASAQEINILENLTDAEGTMYMPISQAISSNYKYVAGPAMDIMEGSYGMFVMDLESGNYVVEPAVDYYGADIRAVQELLGHESILTTEIYTHLEMDDLRQTLLLHPLAGHDDKKQALKTDKKNNTTD